MSHCLRQTELPNTTRLFADFLYSHRSVAGFYEGSPLDPASYQLAVERLDYPDGRRSAMAAALAELNPPSAQLDLFARSGTVAVVTGQQVGLFSGPCYTVYKALTAAKLAARLNDQGIPAVPVFWLASEDHDFAEVAQAHSFGPGHQPASQRVDAPDSASRPVGDVVPAAYPTAELRASMEGLPFADQVARMVEESYIGGASMAQAFRSLLRRLLPDFGLLYVDPMRPAIRAIAAPLIRLAVERAPALSDLLIARGRELESRGYHAQVHFEAKSALFFLLEQGRRIGLRRDGEHHAHPGGRYSARDLADRAERISPNALLRPVVQDFLLPTVAQVGGPAEIAYLAQTQALYRGLDRRGPVVVPRAGFTLLDPRSDKLLSRYRLSIPQFFGGFEALRERMAASLVPPELASEIAAVRSSTTASLDALRNRIDGFDPTLAAALDKSRAKILHQLGKVDAKAARESLRRDARALEDARSLFSLVCPDRHPQERLYTILPFLAKHGTDLVDRLYDQLSLDCPDHLVAVV
jgi:bacillithiol biosynthesis cysteine-adding enzyme BshC